MTDSLYTLVYAAVLALVCATALTGVDRFTADRKQANAKAEEIRNILGVLGVAYDPDASVKQLVEAFDQNVQIEHRDELTTYAYRPYGEGSTAQAVAVAFAGPGLWGPVKGLLALDADMRTIVGITFYHQEETPGLGGEIGSPWFAARFRGKSITDASGKGGIRIVRSGQAADNEVDAITGATMTCQKVEDMLNDVIERITRKRDANGR